MKTLTQRAVDHLCGTWAVQPEAISQQTNGLVFIAVGEDQEVLFAGSQFDCELRAKDAFEEEALFADTELD
jgi:hypothetical protein